MADIIFDPTNTEKLSVKVSFLGVVQASYIYTLWEAFSNQIVQRVEGNNLNPDDDKFDLPLPSSSNLNRVIEVRTAFYGIDHNNHPTYEIRVEVFQGNSLLGFVSDPESPPGDLTGEAQYSVMFIELVSM